jgi:hypothetical protein
MSQGKSCCTTSTALTIVGAAAPPAVDFLQPETKTVAKPKAITAAGKKYVFFTRFLPI